MGCLECGTRYACTCTLPAWLSYLLGYVCRHHRSLKTTFASCFFVVLFEHRPTAFFDKPVVERARTHPFRVIRRVARRRPSYGHTVVFYGQHHAAASYATPATKTETLVVVVDAVLVVVDV